MSRPRRETRNTQLEAPTGPAPARTEKPVPAAPVAAPWHTGDFSHQRIAAMPDGISILDSRGVHVGVNPAFCWVTGFTCEELLGSGPLRCPSVTTEKGADHE